MKKDNIILFLIAIASSSVDVFGFTWGQYICIIIIALYSGQGLNISRLSGLVKSIAFLVLTSLPRFSQYSIYMLKDVSFMTIGILPFLLGTRFKIEVKRLNSLLLIAFFVSVGINIFGIHFTQENMLNSNTGVELSILGFVFPLFAIYFALHRKWKWAFVNFFIAILAGKRIAFIGMVLGIILSFFFRNERKTKFKYKALALSVVLLVMLMTYLFTIGFFDTWIYDSFGVNANHLSMGRQSRYAAVVNDDLLLNLFGIGPGNVQSILLKQFQEAYLLHNDVLKIFVENGIIISIVYFVVFFYGMENRQVPFAIYTLILFVTDNTLIYSSMLFLYGMFWNFNSYCKLERK